MITLTEKSIAKCAYNNMCMLEYKTMNFDHVRNLCIYRTYITLFHFNDWVAWGSIQTGRANVKSAASLLNWKSFLIYYFSILKRCFVLTNRDSEVIFVTKWKFLLFNSSVNGSTFATYGLRARTMVNCRENYVNKITIVLFKRLGSRVSHDSFNQYVLFFQNNVHTAKQMQYTVDGILSDF